MTGKLVLRAASKIIAGYLGAVSRSASFTVGLDDGRTIQHLAEERISQLSDEIFSASPAILGFWNAHSLLLLALYGRVSQLRFPQARFEAVADDSMGGLLTADIFDRFDIPWRRLSYVSPPQRLDDIRSILEERPNLVIAADSHGPYKSLSSGMARLVGGYNGLFWPISLWASRSIKLFRGLDMALPLPKSTIVAVVGLPVDLRTKRLPVHEGRQRLERSLSDLETRTMIVAQRAVR